MLERNKQEKKKIYVWMARIFCCSLLIVFLISLVKKDRTFSETENRMLEEKPKMTLETVLSGRFMKRYDSYTSDQFFGRDFWVSAKTKVDLLMGKREANGIYKGKDNYLIEKQKRPDEAMLKRNLQAMKAFQKAYSKIPMRMLLVPNAVSVLENKLPTFAPKSTQQVFLKQVKKELGKGFTWIDADKVLRKHQKEPIYYHTDHHWTTLGAYYTYEEFLRATGKKKENWVSFDPYCVTTTFNGTLSASSGYERNETEAIHIYAPKEDKTRYVVEYVEEQKKTTSVYDASHLKEKDQYALFFDGNHAQIQIRTTSKSKEKLLVFKDSYANCFVPFLIPYYREIVMIDPRYYYGELNELMESKQFTEVLFLYNGNTFAEDNSIGSVLATQ